MICLWPLGIFTAVTSWVSTSHYMFPFIIHGLLIIYRAWPCHQPLLCSTDAGDLFTFRALSYNHHDSPGLITAMSQIAYFSPRFPSSIGHTDYPWLSYILSRQTIHTWWEHYCALILRPVPHSSAGLIVPFIIDGLHQPLIIIVAQPTTPCRPLQWPQAVLMLYQCWLSSLC